MISRGLRPVDRSKDDLVLTWIALRVAGWTPSRIGTRFGISANTVATQIERVWMDDIAESGTVRPGDDPASAESEATVMAAYWKPMRTRK